MQPAVERSKFLKGQKNCQFLLQLFLNALFFSFSAHGAFGLTYISNTPRVFQGRKKNSILQQELWDLIYLHESKLFSFQFSFTSLFLLLNFGMQAGIVVLLSEIVKIYELEK